MFEAEEQQEIESGVVEASPEPSKPEQEEAAVKQASETPKEESKEENVPFHKHPRWIERDNELKAERQARQDLENRYKEINSKLEQLSAPKTPDKRAAMLERLKGIDPEFAEFVSGLAPTKELEELRTERAQAAAQAQRQQVYSQIDKLHDQHKVDAKMRDRYMRDIEFAIARNPQARLEDLPNIYKGVHEDYTSWMEQIRRTDRETYAKAKQESAKAPVSQTRGTPAKPSKGKDGEWSNNKDEARQQLIQKVLTQAKANQDI